MTPRRDGLRARLDAALAAAQKKRAALLARTSRTSRTTRTTRTTSDAQKPRRVAASSDRLARSQRAALVAASRAARSQAKAKLRAELRTATAAARATAKANARAAIARSPALQKRRERRRRTLVALLLLLALLLLVLLRCECREEPAPVVEEPAPAAPPAVGPRYEAKVTPPTARVTKKPRPPFATGPAVAPAWLSALHMQVAARSPRLAACFNGIATPGALRWTANVHVATGVVSDQALEPASSDVALTATQRTCVLQALAMPRYRLPATADDGLAQRVSLLVEF